MLKKLVDKAKEQASRITEQAREKINEATDNVQQLKDMAAGKISETGNQIQQLKDKATEGLAEKKQELADLKDKALEKITLERLIPDVKNIIRQKVVPLLNIQTLGKAVGDDRIQAAFLTAYEFLPAPVRMVIGQETFLRFCNANKSSLMDSETETQLLAAGAQAPQRFSNADELIKLKQLLDSGVLTEEEFAVFKQQLM